MLGAAEWFAQKKGPGADEPTVLYGDTAGQKSMSYAAAEAGKPFWLLTAFPRDQK
jgi:hypothetical protein